MLKEAEKRALDLRVGGQSAYLGGFAMPTCSPEMLKQRGYHMVSGTLYVAMFRQAAVEDVKLFISVCMENVAEEGDDKESDGYLREWDEFRVFPGLFLISLFMDQNLFHLLSDGQTF